MPFITYTLRNYLILKLFYYYNRREYILFKIT